MIKNAIIEINHYDTCTVTVKDDTNRKIKKHIGYEKLLQMLNAASANDYGRDISAESDFELSEVFPGDNIVSVIQTKAIPKSNSKWYIMLRESVPANVIHVHGKFENVAMPRTIFAVKIANNRCVSLRITCIKDGFIDDDTDIYNYPFSNVYDSRSVCLGQNRLNDFDIERTTNIAMIPEMFLAMTNNDDGYSSYLGLKHIELLELLSNSSFDNEILRKGSVKTYKDFVKILV